MERGKRSERKKCVCLGGRGEWAKGLGRGDLFSKLTLLNLIEIDVEKCWIKIK